MNEQDTDRYVKVAAKPETFDSIASALSTLPGIREGYPQQDPYSPGESVVLVVVDFEPYDFDQRKLNKVLSESLGGL